MQSPFAHGLLVAALLIVVLAMVLVLIRALKGETAHDRILAGNAFGSCTVIAILLLSRIVDNVQFVDIALTYALMNFTATIAFLKYTRYGHFDVDSPDKGANKGDSA